MKPSEVNREERALLVRTAGYVLVRTERFEEAMSEAKRLMLIAEEDKNWVEYLRFWEGSVSIRLDILCKLRQWDEFEVVANNAISALKTEAENLKDKSTEEIRWLSSVHHNIAASLLGARRYAQALPLFRFAVEHQDEAMSHFWLAVCIWALFKDRKSTLEQLKIAQRTVFGGMRGRLKGKFLMQPEFNDVRDDEEFTEALSL